MRKELCILGILAMLTCAGVLTAEGIRSVRETCRSHLSAGCNECDPDLNFCAGDKACGDRSADNCIGYYNKPTTPQNKAYSCEGARTVDKCELPPATTCLTFWTCVLEQEGCVEGEQLSGEGKHHASCTDDFGTHT